MRVSMKDGVLTVALSKTEQKQLHAASELCVLITSMQPIPPKLTEAATVAVSSLKAVCDLSTKLEPPAPILDAIERAGSIDKPESGNG